MTLRDEIVPFTDGNGLVAPGPVSPGTIRGSDNGVMYCSEYYVMLKMLGQLESQDFDEYQAKIGPCVNPQGMLCRVPVAQSNSQEGPDDYYGVLNGCMQMGNTTIPRQLLWGLIKNLGFMDNVNPGSHSNWGSFMPRQLQLVACMITASFPGWNPLHILIRRLAAPLFVYAALCILVAGWRTKTDDTDARRLSWHVWQCLKGKSLLCSLASKIWLKRLYKDYGPMGMQAVAAIYYQGNHPFRKYWVTE